MTQANDQTISQAPSNNNKVLVDQKSVENKLN